MQIAFVVFAMLVTVHSLASQAPTACVDTADFCAEWVCTNGYYNKEQQKEYCAKTCGFCATTTTPKVEKMTTTPKPVCKDEYDCTFWVANGFCTDDFFKPHIKEMYCAKSCGFC